MYIKCWYKLVCIWGEGLYDMKSFIFINDRSSIIAIANNTFLYIATDCSQGYTWWREGGDVTPYWSSLLYGSNTQCNANGSAYYWFSFGCNAMWNVTPYRSWTSSSWMQITVSGCNCRNCDCNFCRSEIYPLEKYCFQNETNTWLNVTWEMYLTKSKKYGLYFWEGNSNHD